MTDLARDILPLWNYGWCDHDSLVVPILNKPEDVISSYINSESFCTSFVGPKRDFFPELHGPFFKSLISESDFEQISHQQFNNLLGGLRQPEGFSAPATEGDWDPVLRLATEVSARNAWCFKLRPNENDFDRFHEWGSVLEVFREFLFANPDSEMIERLVFGYD
jgi:hypothetical protein